MLIAKRKTNAIVDTRIFEKLVYRDNGFTK